jgi:hypothetical protein
MILAIIFLVLIITGTLLYKDLQKLHAEIQEKIKKGTSSERK